MHGQGNDPAAVVGAARRAGIDLLAITDHQTFRWHKPIAALAAGSGRKLRVLPGIEITTVEGVHVIGIFPEAFSETDQQQFLGWLKITGSGETREASQQRCEDILREIDSRGGIVVVPHPKTPGIGMMDSARKLNIKAGWLESGYIRLMQAPDEYVKYVARDDEENFVNRFVLASSRPQDVRASNYCLAPFNRSDAHKSEEIADGCSWFRMQEASVCGLKQVACEPRTRIARSEPPSSDHDWIMGVRVSGGYCDGQFFIFSDGLNCLVGPNHAGKSAVFDFLRFGLGGEDDLPEDSRRKLLNRLTGILGDSGSVELFVRSEGNYYLVRRTFRPVTVTRHGETHTESCEGEPAAYRYDPSQHGLVPVAEFTFAVEIYEQGRIGRLRDDLDRQLDMLDEFAHLQGLKGERATVIAKLRESAQLLRPLYEERETLKSDLAGLPEIETELAEKAKLIPDEEEESRWAKADEAADAIEAAVDGLQFGVSDMPAIGAGAISEDAAAIESLFGQRSPDIASERIAEAELLAQWASSLQTALDTIEKARESITAAVEKVKAASAGYEKRWTAARKQRQDEVRAQLAKAKVDSPSELINRVKELRRLIHTLRKVKVPRLAEVDNEIGKSEAAHERLVNHLKQLDSTITERRQGKARELSQSLQDQIRIEVLPAKNTELFERLLHELCDKITNQGHRISNRKGQLQKVVESLTPIQLAEALKRKGALVTDEGEEKSLDSLCGITRNTQNVLCRIADDIRLLTELQTVPVPDVPHILVRRRGETQYANLRTGLSPGEQSAAILTMALQTRRRPLVIDQPEDELGYSYVVHLVVPKILEVKGTRQLLVISHNANIPVLGDADFVAQMDNKPLEGGGRRCVIERAGCFECPAITDALRELDGGKRAFAFRQYRYALSR